MAIKWTESRTTQALATVIAPWVSSPYPCDLRLLVGCISNHEYSIKAAPGDLVFFSGRTRDAGPRIYLAGITH